ncbi:MAG: lasso peptide isopeptide bond-forming cyclase [Rhodothermales bacterium]
MSGIIGIHRMNGRPVRGEDLDAMMAPLAHRGPDGRGVWHDDHAGLGHLALNATLESVFQRLPMTDAAGTLHLTADARIDNRDELIAALGIAHRPVTDAALILAAYERWGDRCPERLIGAYAFAVWDSRRRRLFCARDHYGLKPFFYSFIPGRLFAFGSEAKALLALDEVPRELDEATVAEHLCAPVQSDASGTFYRHIRRLTPGTFLVVEDGRIRHERYWQLDPTHELRLGSDGEYAEALRALFIEAVRCRTRSALPVGAMLSGGIDSSSIASVAAPQAADEGGTLRTYSAVFDIATASDERAFIQPVLDRYRGQMTPFFMAADGYSPLHESDRMMRHQDSPVEAGNFYINWTLHQQARADGCGVILEGFDGDTTLSHGVGYLHELATRQQWYTLYREIKAQTGRAGQPWQQVMWRWVKRYKIEPGLQTSAGLRLARHVKNRLPLRRQTLPAPEAATLSWRTILSPDFLSRIEQHLAPSLPIPETEREDHYRQIMRPLMNRTVELLEASASAAGLELRLPFCDRRLLEFCLSLPPNQKRRMGWNRYAMRQAMQGILPPEVQWRESKGDLGHAFNRGLLVHAGEPLHQAIDQDLGGVGRFVDLGVLQAQYPRLDPPRAGQPTHFHWRALSLALWLNEHGF